MSYHPNRDTTPPASPLTEEAFYESAAPIIIAMTKKRKLKQKLSRDEKDLEISLQLVMKDMGLEKIIIEYDNKKIVYKRERCKF